MPGRKIDFVSIEEMFGVPKADKEIQGSLDTSRELVKSDIIVDIDKMRDWHTDIDIPGIKIHPFRRLSEEKKLELRKSIERHGIIEPIILREDTEPGYYEVIAGHNRRDQEIALGRKQLSTAKHEIRILENCSDTMAAYWMIDSNIKRDEDLPSEKMSAYSIKYKLLKQEIERNPELMGEAKRVDEIVAKTMGVSRTTLQRYLSLKKLVPGMLDLTDNKKLTLHAAELASSLQADQQQELLEAIKETEKVPGLAVMEKIRETCDAQFCSAAELCEILTPTAPIFWKNLRSAFKSAEKQIKELEIDDSSMADIDNEELESVVTAAIKTYLKTQSKIR